MIRSNCVWILFSLIGISHLTDGTEPWNGHSSYSSYPTQSSSSQNGQVSPKQPTFDYSTGFPSGFTSGLPTFDFTGPMPAATENNEQRQGAESENLGFVHGPPDGFPNLEQLGGSFPSFGENSASGSHPPPRHDNHHNNYHHQRHPQPPPHSSSSSPSEYSTEDDDFALPGPRYRSDLDTQRIHPSASHPNHNHGGPPPLYRRPLPPPQHGPNHFQHGPHQYVKQAGSSPHQSSYPRPPYPPSPKKPIVLKVSGKKTIGGKLPPGPPVFYAPSPDMQSSHQESARAPAHDYDQENIHNHRFRRSIDDTKESKKIHPVTSSKLTQEDYNDDQQMDGTDDTYWELTSPFILFDTYKKPEEERPSSNISFDGDVDGGEQRFFPSFPAPYLTGYGGGPPSRPPLFPGPAANRAPSRHHPHFHGPKFAPPPPPPNRGPSNVYSAESHDHYQDNNLLGSGNFEVVRGGTYYGDEDDGYHGGGGGGGGGGIGFHDDEGDYYHHNHNGHSSPQEGYRVPGQDFFANFRDFADINPPRSFSHHHEALASELRHVSTSPAKQPKNILDQLESTPPDHGSIKAKSSISRESDPMMATF